MCTVAYVNWVVHVIAEEEGGGGGGEGEEDKEGKGLTSSPKEKEECSVNSMNDNPSQSINTKG